MLRGYPCGVLTILGTHNKPSRGVSVTETTDGKDTASGKGTTT